jgi:hypothetical protein
VGAGIEALLDQEQGVSNEVVWLLNWRSHAFINGNLDFAAMPSIAARLTASEFGGLGSL